MIKNVLFDLDGSLLYMDSDKFMNIYFKTICKVGFKYGYEPVGFIKSIMKGTQAMVLNDGSKTNEEVFWETFEKLNPNYDKNIIKDLNNYYETDFNKVKDSCKSMDLAKVAVKKCKDLGLNITLATNPIFPRIATMNRIAWANLDPKDFNLITTYENSSYCKPNLKYYESILNRFNYKPEETLMIGNDCSEDLVINKLGVNVFLLTHCLINPDDVDLSNIPHGSFEDLLVYLDNLN